MFHFLICITLEVSICKQKIKDDFKNYISFLNNIICLCEFIISIESIAYTTLCKVV